MTETPPLTDPPTPKSGKAPSLPGPAPATDRSSRAGEMRRWLPRLAVAMTLIGSGYLAIILLCMALGIGCGCVSRQVHQFRVRDSRTGPLVVNSRSRKIFAAAEDAEEIVVFDLDRFSTVPLARVPTLGYHEVAIDEQKDRVYVVQAFSRSIRVIDGRTFAFHDIEVPNLKLNLGVMAVDEDRHRLFVFQPDDLNIRVIDTESEAVLEPIGAGCCPTKSVRMAVDPATGLLYVVDRQVGITVYEAGGRQVAGPIHAGDHPRDIVIDGRRQRAYVTNIESANVTELDLATNSPRRHTVIRTIELRDRPLYLALDPISGRAYFPFLEASRLGIVYLDAESETRSVTLPYAPSILAIDRATNRAVIGAFDGIYSIIQLCPARITWPSFWRSLVVPASPAAPPTPVGYDDEKFAKDHSERVECERMYRTRTWCGPATEFREMALVERAVATRGARLAPDQSSARLCGLPADQPEPDLAAAGYYYALPVVEAGHDVPSVWTFHLDQKTPMAHPLPSEAEATLVTTRPVTVWDAVLWRHARCKTGLVKDVCCAE